MTLLWMDGFEGFTTGGNRTVLDPVYDFPGATSTGDIGVIASTRVTGKMVDHNEGGSQIGTPEMVRVAAASPSGSDTFIVGFAHYVNNQDHEETELLQFRDSGVSAMITLKLKGGTIHARRVGIDGTVLGMASANIPCHVWHFIECKVRFHDTAGTIDVRVNEEEVMSLSGIDTKPGSDNSPSYVYVAGSNHNMGVYLDDWYICDAAGSVNNDFLGDSGIRQLRTNANGATNDFVGSDGNSTDNYLLVDDEDPDDDATYAGSATVGEKDLYGVQSLSSTPAHIDALSLVTYGKKTDSGAKTFVHVCRSGTTESDSSAISPAETYGHHYSIYETDPDTSSAWTESGVNAVQAGVKVAS